MAETLPIINGRYRLQAELGSGGMGVVFRAWDRLTGQLVALKQVLAPTEQLLFNSRTDNDSNGLRLALAQEFRLLASLRHPNIISVLDYGFDSQRRPYITMNLLENALPIKEAARGLALTGKFDLLIQTLQALAYLHRRGILHRDIKPGNVLVVDGQVRVVDFGLSVRREQSQGAVGTLAYMAPEIIQGQAATEAADLYAMGVIAYDLLTGQMPFKTERSSELVLQILYTPPDLTPFEADPALAAVIKKLLAKDPEDRYQDAAQVITDLSEAIQRPLPAETSAIRESFLQAARFVGREAEMAHLTTALQNALKGQGSSWLVGGESGVGKSRLLDELRIPAVVAGALVLRGQGVMQGGLPYQLWRDVLPHLILNLHTPLTELEAGILKLIVPNIGDLLGKSIPDAPDLNEETAPKRLYTAVTNLFRQQRQPVVLLLEDLQWATESLEILKQLNLSVAEMPLLIVVNYRDDERPDLPGDLPGMHGLKLGRLNQQAIQDLSTAMLGAAGTQPQVVELLQRETEGNVFFVVEVVRALAEEVGRLTDIGKIALPEKVFAAGMQQIIRRRLSRVATWATPLLKSAAVAGRQIDTALLRLVHPPQDLDRWLNVCEEAAIIEVLDQRWQFAHDKLREVVLADLSPQERPVLHRQIAEAIEQVYTDWQARAAILFDHWHEAGEPAKEQFYAILAGEQARAVGSHNEAVRFFERALALVAPHENELYLSTLLKLAEAQRGRGAFKDAEHLLETHLSQIRQTENKALIGRTLYILSGSAYRLGDYARTEIYLQESLALARELQNPIAMGDCLNLMGLMVDHTVNIKLAEQYFLESIDYCRQGGQQSGIALGYNNLAACAIHQGDVATSQRYMEQALQIWREIGDVSGISGGLNNLGFLEYAQGRYEPALQYFSEGLNLARKTGNHEGMTDNLLLLGHTYVALNQLEQARENYQSALRDAIAYQTIPVMLHAVIGFAKMRMKMGEYEQAGIWLGLACQHPARDPDVTGLVGQPALEELKALMPADQFDSAIERGQGLALDTVIKLVLSDGSPDNQINQMTNHEIKENP